MKSLLLFYYSWLSVLDAAGKLPVGLFQGNLNWIGQYDQCNLISANRSNPITGEYEIPFNGSYCDIKMQIPDSIEIPAAVR